MLRTSGDPEISVERRLAYGLRGSQVSKMKDRQCSGDVVLAVSRERVSYGTCGS